jgi:transcriptional regulator with XRE-family HTH domain
MPFLAAVLLREARLRAGLTQAELGRRSGRPQSTIARWESGAVDPGLETLVEVVRACGLELTVGIAQRDESYLPLIERMLALSPAERIAHGTRVANALRQLREMIESARAG